MHKPLHLCNNKGETPYPEKICCISSLYLTTSTLFLFVPNLLIGYKNKNMLQFHSQSQLIQL